jgi:hypothetical protein
MKNVLLSIILLVTIKVIGQIPTTGLLAYYPFCGNANDLSGSALNGTVVGATLSTDRFGHNNSAYTFNGSSNYIELPASNFVGLNIYSYSIWIKPTSTTAGLPYSIGSNDPYCQSLSFNSTSVSAGSYNNGSNPLQSYVFSNTLPGINNWIHVVVTRDMSDLKLYVNGSLIAASTGNTNNQAASYGSTPPYRAILGARSTLQQYFFDGQIDDVRIYSTVLTQNEVTQLFNEAPSTLNVNSGTICAGNSFTLVPSGGYSYVFSGGSAVVSPTVTTSYTVTENAVNCGATAASTVTVFPNPVISISGPSVICKGEIAVLVANGANSYSWSTNSAAPSITVTPTTTSNFAVTGTGNGGCSNAALHTVSVSECTGLEQSTSNILDVNIAPNPNNGNFSISFPDAPKGPGHFIIESLDGKTTQSFKLEGSENMLDVSLDMVPGVYIGKLVVNGEHLNTKRIIITR